MIEISVEEYEQRLFDWRLALRSGGFEQTKGGLHKPGDGYCCLGVGSEVSRLGFWSEAFTEQTTDGETLCSWIPLKHQDEVRGLDSGEISERGITVEACLMPEEVLQYYGIVNDHGTYDWFDLKANLRWNILRELMTSGNPISDEERGALLDRDPLTPNRLKFHVHTLVFLNDHGVPFRLIADVLEAKPKGLFTWSDDGTEGG